MPTDPRSGKRSLRDVRRLPPPVRTRPEPLSEDALEVRATPPPPQMPRPAQATPPAPAAELAPLLKGRAALRRAMLLHEILSSPLALRDEEPR
jgi:hypothetical protein